MDILSTQTLLDMLREWYNFLGDRSQLGKEPHPHLQKLFKELFLRGIIDQGGQWLVNPVRMDMEFVRV